MSEAFTINSEPTFVAFCKHVRDLYDKNKYITFTKPRIGPDRSIDQNALLHVWLTEWAAFIFGITKKQVTPAQLEGMKRAAKGKFYAANHEPFMVHVITNPFTGEKKREYTSSKLWKRGEMYFFLTWLQMMAANDGLVLEAKGEFEKLRRKELEAA